MTTTATTILTRTKTGASCYNDAAKLAAGGDLPAAAFMARSSAEAYADVAEAVARVDGAGSTLRARLYCAAAERSATLATTMAALTALAGADNLAEANVSAEFATRALRRANIAVDPRLADSDVSDRGLARATEIAEAFTAVAQASGKAQEHAEIAHHHAADGTRTVVAVDAAAAAEQARAAAHQSARAAALALGMAPGAYRDGATAAPQEATCALASAIAADQAASEAELLAHQMDVSENLAALRSHIASPAGR